MHTRPHQLLNGACFSRVFKMRGRRWVVIESALLESLPGATSMDCSCNFRELGSMLSALDLFSLDVPPALACVQENREWTSTV